MDKIKNELIKHGFVQNTSNNWSRRNEIVQIVRSVKYPKIRLTWREYWKEYSVIIFDYSNAGGPISVLPVKDFFSHPFVDQKRKGQAYVNSGFYWTQTFNLNDDFAQFVLSFENRWDILGNETPGNRNNCYSYQHNPIEKTPKQQYSIPKFRMNEEKDSKYKSLCKGFSTKDLFHLYCDLMEELRERGEIRSSNNPVSDYGEKLVANLLNLKLAVGSNKGYDAIDEKTGLRYQIKTRRITKYNKSRQLGVIRNLDQRPFDYLIAIIFDEYLNPNEIWQIPIEAIAKHAKFSGHQNGHILILRENMLQENNVKKLQ